MHHLKARYEAQVARRVERFDSSTEWASQQSGSAAAWLRRVCRLSESEARATVRRAKHVRAMPWVAECWAAGSINTSHVDVIVQARNAAQDDEAFAEFEDQFANVALHGSPEDVSRVARPWRDALDNDRQPADTPAVRDYESRGLHLSKTLDGRWVENATYDAEGGSYADRAIKHMYEVLHKQGDERTPAQQRVDAQVAIYREYLAGLPEGSN